MDDDLLPIGRFARLTGLTIGALRHYDEEGVLGARRRGPGNRLSALPARPGRDGEGHRRAPGPRAVAAGHPRPAGRLTRPATAAAILRDERARLEARTARLQRALHRLGVLAATNPDPRPHHEGDPRADPPTPPELSPELHRALGAGLYNRCWDLMEIEDRTHRPGRRADRDRARVRVALAPGGHTANRSRGHWMCSRVYAVLGRAEPALYHARRCVEIVEAGGEGIEDWDAPAAYEAMARALAVAGDLAGARRVEGPGRRRAGGHRRGRRTGPPSRAISRRSPSDDPGCGGCHADAHEH